VQIPEDIAKYLIKDEIIDRQFDLKEQIVFTSTKRMFIKRGNFIRDIGYDHISSIELQEKRKWWLFYIGVVIILCSFLIRQFPSPSWASYFPESRLMYSDSQPWFYYAVGVVLAIVGFRSKTLNVELKIVGASQEQILSGGKAVLYDLLQVTNERRFHSKSNLPEVSEPTHESQ
jgi:hypothetical protein